MLPACLIACLLVCRCTLLTAMPFACLVGHLTDLTPQYVNIDVATTEEFRLRMQEFECISISVCVLIAFQLCALWAVDNPIQSESMDDNKNLTKKIFISCRSRLGSWLPDTIYLLKYACMRFWLLYSCDLFEHLIFLIGR